MSRQIVATVLVSVVFFCGFVIAGRSGEASGFNEQWQPSVAPVITDSSRVLERLATSNRWRFALGQEVADRVSGEFNQDYRLLAVVEGETAYALMGKRSLNGDSMFKIAVGDQLDDGWVISAITDTSVVARRDGEVQSVELFPVE